MVKKKRVINLVFIACTLIVFTLLLGISNVSAAWTDSLNIGLRWYFDGNTTTSLVTSPVVTTTLVGSATNGTDAGIIGKGFYVAGTDSNTISYNFGEINFTLNWWVKSSDGEVQYMRIDGTNVTYCYYHEGGVRGEYCVVTTGPTPVSTAEPEDTVNYHMITLTQNATSQALYVNGVVKSVVTQSKFQDGTHLSSKGGGATGLTGNLDEWSYWNRTLTAAEIVQLYNGGAGITWQPTSVNAYPQINYTTPTELNSTNKSQTWIYVNVTVNDTDEANITFRLYNDTFISLNNTTYTDNRTYINFTGLSNGVYYYNVTVADTLNQQNTTETRKITLDTVSPLINQTNPASASYQNGSVNFNWTVNDTTSGILNTTIYVYNQTTGSLINNTTKTSSDLTSILNSLVGVPMVLTDGFYNWFVNVFDFAGNYNATTNETFTIDTTPPWVIFNYQIPADLNVTNFLGPNGVNISYNISDNLAGVNNSTILLFYKSNSTSSNVMYYQNGTAFSGFFNATYLTNTTPTFIWNLPDNFVLPATYNYNETLMENTVHTQSTLNSAASYVAIQLLNVSNSTQYGFYEVMANSTSIMRFYYCNSSFTAPTNPLTSTNCILIFTEIANDPYDHMHTANSAHHVVPFVVNTTTGMVGTVKVTETSWFLVRGNNFFGNQVNFYTIPTTSRVGAMRTTFNNGFTWTNQTYTVDSHMHQFNNTSSLWYYACANDTRDNQNCSVLRQDLFDLTGLPPTSPNVYNPAGETYQSGNININYTASESPNGYAIVYYNITLANASDFSYISAIQENNSVNLSYVWNSTTTPDGVYKLSVKVYDNVSQSSIGFSENFTVDNTPPILSYTFPTENNTSNKSQSWIYVNTTVSDTNFANLTFRLYNSVFGLVSSEVINNSSTAYNNFTSLANGIYYYNVTVADLANNQVTLETRKITLDTIAPLINQTNPANASYQNGSVNFNWTLNDSTSGIANTSIYVYNQSSGSLINNTTIQSYEISNIFNTLIGIPMILTDGIYNWFVNVFDFAGNTNSTANKTFTIDTIGPQINFSSGITSNNSNISRTWIYVNVSVSDITTFNTSFILYNSTPGTIVNQTTYTNNSTEFNWTSLSDGHYSYEVNVTDSAGNTNSSGKLNITLDTHAPILGKSYPSNTTWTDGLTTYFTFDTLSNSVDSTQRNLTTQGGTGGVNGTYAGKIGYSGYVNSADNWKVINLANVQSSSEWTLNYWLNVTSAPAELSMWQFGDCGSNNYWHEAASASSYFAGIGPFMTLDSNDVSNVWIMYTLIKNSSGYYGYYNGNRETSGALSFTNAMCYLSLYSQGNFYYDELGFWNRSLTDNEVRYLYNNSAGITYTSNPIKEATYINTNNVPFNFSVDDPTSGVYNTTLYIYNNSSGSLINNTTKTYSELNLNNNNISVTVYLPDGIYQWDVAAYDFSNNFVDPNDTIIIDTVYPLINYTTPTEINTSNKSQTWIYVNVTVNETNEAQISFRLYNNLLVSINNTTYTDNRTYENFTGLTSGIYYYNVTVTDLAGNQNTTETRKITLDTIAPLINQTNPANNTISLSPNISLNWTLNDSLSGIFNTTLYVYNATNGTLINQTTKQYYELLDIFNAIIGIPMTLTDGAYNWFIDVFDFAGNYNATANETFTVDSEAPRYIYFIDPTKSNNTYEDSNWIFANVNLDIYNLANLTYYLYNYTSGALLNNTTYNSTSSLVSASKFTPALSENISSFETGLDGWTNSTNAYRTNEWASNGTFSIKFDTTAQDELIYQVFNLTGVNYLIYDFNLTQSADPGCFLLINGTPVAQLATGNNQTINLSNYIGYYNVSFDCETGTDFCGPSKGYIDNIKLITNSSYYYPYSTLVSNPTHYDFTNLSSKNITNLALFYDNDYDTTSTYNTPGGTGWTNESWDVTGINESNLYYRLKLARVIDPNYPVRIYNHTSGSYVNLTDYINYNEDNDSSISSYVKLFNISNSDFINSGIVNISVYVYLSSTVFGCSYQWDERYYYESDIGSFGAYTLANNWTGLVDGKYLYNVTATKFTGINNSTETRWITLDTITPLINYSAGVSSNNSIINDRNWTYINVSVTETNQKMINFTLYKSGTLYSYYNNSSLLSYGLSSYDYNFTNLPDGNYTYNVTTEDQVNRTNSTPTMRIIIDMNAPNATNIAPANYTNSSNATINFSISANDSFGLKNATLYVYNATGQYSNATTYYIFNPEGVASQTIGIILTLVDGTYKWFFRVFDMGLLYTDTENYTIDVITSAPTVSIIFPVNGGTYNNTTQVSYLNYTVAGANLSKCWYEVNAAVNYSAMTTPGNNFTVVPQEGSNTYIVFCNNSVNLIGNDTHTFTLDTGAPTITITSPSPAVDYAMRTGDIDLNFSVSDTHLDSCWYWYNGSINTIACGAAHKSLSLNGTIVNMTNNMMVFYANDTYGNQANKTIYWYYKIFENARYYNNTTWETDTETYILDVNGTGNATITGVLNYDGSNIATTKTGNDSRTNFTYIRAITAGDTGLKSLYWKINYDAETIYTNTSTQRINLTSFFYPCNATSNETASNVVFSNITFKDEVLLTSINASIDQLVWYYWLSNISVNKTFTLPSTGNNTSFGFCFTPNNRTVYSDISILYSNVGANYPQRQYVNHSYTLNNNTTNTTLYLLSTTDGKWVQILTADLSGLALSGVTITVTRNIAGVDTLVSSGVTDASGSVLFFLNPSFPHTFQLSKSGCTNQTVLITPTQSSYTITVACGTNLPTAPYNSSLEQVRYFRYPVPGVVRSSGVNVTNTTFIYYVDSQYRNISRAMFAIAYANRTVIAVNQSFSGTPYCNNSSCYLTLERTFNPGDDLKGAYWVDLGDGYILLESDARWKYILSNTSDTTTILKGFSNLKDIIASWHTINESGLSCELYLGNSSGCVSSGCYWANDTNTCYDFNVKNRQEYSRFVLIFLLLAIVLAIIGRITGYDAQNPGVFLIILTVVVAFGTFSNGLTDGYFYYSDLTPWAFLNNIFFFVTVGMVSIGYWASVTRRHT